MVDFSPYVISIIVAILASSGFWVLIQKKLEKKDNRTKLLLGLTHDRVFYLGMKYINRKWITHDELNNLQKYLAEPYYELGGNGIVREIVNRCTKLEIKRVEDLTTEDLNLLSGMKELSVYESRN